MNDMGWTDDRIERLKKAWLDGKSSSEIAKQLGGVSRNAVIGKVSRLRLKRSEAAARISMRLQQPQPRSTRPPPAPRPAPRPLSAAQPMIVVSIAAPGTL